MTRRLHPVPDLIPDVPAPTGYTPDGWADLDTDGPPWRTIWGVERHIEEKGIATVQVSRLQYVDGVIEDGGDESPVVHVHVYRDWGMSAADARQVAALGYWRRPAGSTV